MKVYADNNKNIKIFAKVNGLNIKTNYELEKYHKEIGDLEFMFKHCHTILNYNGDYDLNFIPANREEYDFLTNFFKTALLFINEKKSA